MLFLDPTQRVQEPSLSLQEDIVDVVVDFRIVSPDDVLFTRPDHYSKWNRDVLQGFLSELERDGHFVRTLLDQKGDDPFQGEFANVLNPLAGQAGFSSPWRMAQEAARLCRQGSAGVLVLRPLAGIISPRRIQGFLERAGKDVISVSSCDMHHNANPVWTIPMPSPALPDEGGDRITLPAFKPVEMTNATGSHDLPRAVLVDGAIALISSTRPLHRAGEVKAGEVKVVYCPETCYSPLHTLLMRAAQQ